MEQAYGLEISGYLAETTAPGRSALIVFDMQVGIVSLMKDAGGVPVKVKQT